MALITWEEVNARIRSEVNVLKVLAEMTAKELTESRRVIAERDEEIAGLKREVERLTMVTEGRE